MSSLHLALYSFGSSLTQTGSSSVLELLETIGNSDKDGIQWHNVPCYFRSRVICEDSELQMERVRKESGVDVTIPLSDAAPRK